MPVRDITDVERLRKINAALISRVERSMDQQGNAFTLFQTAINLENRVRSRTEELRSTLRRLEQSNIDLYSAKEAAEQANLSKTRFLAAASHDVLQPLNAAHLSVSALAEVQTSEEGRRLVGQVERSLATIGNLLQTLLDISRLDAGVVRPDVTEVALEPLFASLKSDFQPLAEQKGLSFRFRAGNAVVRSDRTMLRRILQNIVSNAMRYTRSGGVLVGARRRGATIRIEVVDTGCGIAEDQQEAVFEEFHRGAGAVESDAAGAGLGLGLSIVRRMADTLGHRIAVSSVVGRGTVFRLDVPAVSPRRLGLHSATSPARPRGYGLFGTKVLLIEDDDAVSAAMVALLAHWQCAVRAAASSGEAIRALGDTDWLPDVIIADQHLADGDLGTETVAAVRAYLGRPVPALIVTGDPSPMLAKTTRAAAIELMRKPVKPAELRALLAHLLA
ncbi:ATP-binding response regulator [Kumtagia ephedrae]|uniref:histidine kinase n=1 Tax=Kumtagia ephedrae TaxID=2116701 RepID=A0A2P7SGY1_9HYPH|nr:hybrid sensor histidine kinase/response regulator [Mesorhizobium ephedrae]PSJ61756.1 hybrid sensor histidine kinase/response regulator [Mesorhizobium ephedrae]